jgi:hypothetical protein
MRRALLTAVAGVALSAALFTACAAPPRVDPLRLDGNLLTAQNQSGHDWTNVEIWINRQFRVTVSKLQAGQVYRAPLDHFVTGYGQQFRFSQMQIRDVRMMATEPDGTRVEVHKQFGSDSLSDTLKGIGGSR